MEAEMNATVTVVLGSPRSFAFLISATVFFFFCLATVHTHPIFFLSSTLASEWLAREKERRKKGGGQKRERYLREYSGPGFLKALATLLYVKP